MPAGELTGFGQYYLDGELDDLPLDAVSYWGVRHKEVLERHNLYVI